MLNTTLMRMASAAGIMLCLMSTSSASEPHVELSSCRTGGGFIARLYNGRLKLWTAKCEEPLVIVVPRHRCVVYSSWYGHGEALLKTVARSYDGRVLWTVLTHNRPILESLRAAMLLCLWRKALIGGGLAPTSTTGMTLCERWVSWRLMPEPGGRCGFQTAATLELLYGPTVKCSLVLSGIWRRHKYIVIYHRKSRFLFGSRKRG